MWTSLTRRAPRRPAAAKSRCPPLRLEALEERETPAILIQVDYSFDTGFFSSPDARAVMEQVAAELGDNLSADLSPIVPGGGNTWAARFFDPATGLVSETPNLTVGANAIRVYVGGRALPGTQVAFGGVGGYASTGTTQWLDTVETRGKSGFSLWGGSIAFSTAQNWFFGQTTDGLADDQRDFYSVAIHELGHVLGIGTSDQWFGQVRDGHFYGANAMAVYGGPVPLEPDGRHWANGVTVGGQAANLDPSLSSGRRVTWSALDAAALRDLGWVRGGPAPSAPPFYSGATVEGGLLILAGTGGIQFVPVPPGAVALFTDVNGDGKGDVLLFLPNVLLVLDGATGGFVAIFADVTGDGVLDAWLFSPPGTSQSLTVGGTGQVFALA